MFALPIFPGSRPPSIVGVHELNFCVRDGNRWTLMTINTNSMWVALNHLYINTHMDEENKIAFLYRAGTQRSGSERKR